MRGRGAERTGLGRGGRRGRPDVWSKTRGCAYELMIGASLTGCHIDVTLFKAPLAPQLSPQPIPAAQQLPIYTPLPFHKIPPPYALLPPPPPSQAPPHLPTPLPTPPCYRGDVHVLKPAVEDIRWCCIVCPAGGPPPKVRPSKVFLLPAGPAYI